MNANDYLNKIRNDQNMMNNPTVKNVFKMLDNKDSKGLKELLNNTCTTMGVNPQDVLNRFK